MRQLMVVVAGVLVSGCGAVSDSVSSSKGSAPVQAFEGPVARAFCGPGSRPETGGIQGRVSLEDRQSGRADEGYACNLEEVGHEGDGTEWQLAWYEDCAYYGLGLAFANGGTAGFVPGAPRVPAGGVAVVDVSVPEAPVRTLTLMTPGMIDPWESLKVNERRGLLAGSSMSIEGAPFDLYDVKTGLVDGVTDCAHPRLIASTANGGFGHEGEWAPDGMTYYSSGFLVPFTTAIDVSIPQAPRVVATINDGIHGLSLNEAGTRLYAAEFTRAGLGVGEAEREATTEEDPGTNGLEIWDTGPIQARAAGLTTTVIPTPLVGAVYWEDGGGAQMTVPVTIKGKPYVIFIDEGGMGMARIIDISDEKNPFVVSKMKLEFDMPEYEEMRATDDDGSFGYNGHYCGVPQRDDPGIVACSYFNSGIRVFDIRNPHHPREIAYFIPKQAYASSAIRFVKERGEMWFTSQRTGLHIVRFTNGVWPFPEDQAPAAEPAGGEDCEPSPTCN